MPILWLDLEMTGLDPESHHIIEVAATVTEWDLVPRAHFHEVVFQPLSVLEQMDEWNRRTHGASGLLSLISQGKPQDQVSDQLVAFMRPWFGDQPAMLAGNSIHQDRAFIRKHMPTLEQRLHYRMLDVSSWKVVFQGKFQRAFVKSQTHRALDDIAESIAELSFYLSHLKDLP
jgi:oligoribonuclease